MKLIYLFLFSVLCWLNLSHGHSLYSLVGGSVGNHPTFLPTPLRVQKINNDQFHDKITEEYRVRQVPGDGGCLFHSLAVCVINLATNKHVNFDSNTRLLSDKLREVSVSVLSDAKMKLYLENGEVMACADMMDMVSKHYDTTTAEYLKAMRDPVTWGGGPEIVALSNYFKRPIHVYELACSKGWLFLFGKKFELRHTAKFGSPAYDGREPICLLCADGRYPNIKPGSHKQPGDHFSPLFPKDDNHMKTLRGGDNDDCDYNEPKEYKYPAQYSADDLIKIVRNR